MKRTFSRWMTMMVLLFAVNSMQVSCSSSEEGTEEEVAASEEGNAAEANEEGQSNEAANNEAANNEGGENTNFANNEGANNEGMNNEGFNQDAEGANAVADNMGQGGDEDLQQIIEDMNGTNSAQLPPPADNSQGFENIANPNQNTAMAPTGDMTAPAAPAASGPAAGPGLPELGSKMVYIVQKGETLAKIAQRVYGDSSKWTEIANFTGLANPRLIYPGDVVYYQLTEQSMSFAGAYESVKRNEVQVSQGDTLASIAGRVLGNSTLWKLIWRQNDKIDNPDRLTAGTTIYYIDPAQVASINTTDEVKSVEVKKSVKTSKSTVSVNKISNTQAANNVYEVANEYVDDFFKTVNHSEMLQRSMI